MPYEPDLAAHFGLNGGSVPLSSTRLSFFGSSRQQKDRNHIARAAAAVLLHAALCAVLSVISVAQEPVSRSAQTTARGINDPALNARVDSILLRMTLEEKVGQLVQYSAGQPTGPGTGRSDYEDMIAKGQIGSLFNVTDPHEINKYQRIAMEKSRLHIPRLNQDLNLKSHSVISTEAEVSNTGSDPANGIVQLYFRLPNCLVGSWRNQESDIRVAGGFVRHLD